VIGDYGPTPDPPKITANGREGFNPLVLGVWENFPEISSITLASGRFFTDYERKNRSAVAVLGNRIAKQIFEENDPIDQTVKINGRIFRVIGVIADPAGQGVIGSDEIDLRTVYIPLKPHSSSILKLRIPSSA